MKLVYGMFWLPPFGENLEAPLIASGPIGIASL
jgi:hypothetical protein